MPVGKFTKLDFARRFKTETLAPLSDDDLAAALQDFVLRGWDVPEGSGGTVPIRMEKQAAAKVVDLCRGEPFLFQLAGEQRLDRERGIIDRGRLYAFRHRALEAYVTTSWPEV